MKFAGVAFSFVFGLIFTCALEGANAAVVASAPTYQIAIVLKESGKKISSMTVLSVDGEKTQVKSSEIDSKTAPVPESTAFEVTAKTVGESKLNLDYKLTFNHRGRELVLAKSQVLVKEGSTERTTLRDSSGNDLLLEVTATQKK